MAGNSLALDQSPGCPTTRKLFSILEIFEKIMIDVDQRSLLTAASRVCCLWRDSINRSTVLRRHLFFEPDSSVPQRTFNPLLIDILPDWFPAENHAFPERRPFTREEIQKWLPRLWGRKKKAMIYEHASWRKMLPCQPPLYSFIRCTIRRGHDPKIHLMALTQPDPDDIVYEEVPARGWSQLREYSSDEVVPELPIPMVRLYNLVERGGNSGGGSEEKWLFEWRDGHRINERLAEYVYGDLRELLVEAIQRDGLVFVEWTNPDGWPEREHEPFDEYDGPPHFTSFQKAGMRLKYEVNDRLDHRQYLVHEVWGRRLRAWHMGYWTCSSEDENLWELGRKIQAPVYN